MKEASSLCLGNGKSGLFTSAGSGFLQHLYFNINGIAKDKQRVRRKHRHGSHAEWFFLSTFPSPNQNARFSQQSYIV